MVVKLGNVDMESSPSSRNHSIPNRGLQLNPTATASLPAAASAKNGLFVYDSTSNTFKGCASGAYVTFATSASVGTLDQVLTQGATSAVVGVQLSGASSVGNSFHVGDAVAYLKIYGDGVNEIIASSTGNINVSTTILALTGAMTVSSTLGVTSSLTAASANFGSGAGALAAGASTLASVVCTGAFSCASWATNAVAATTFNSALTLDGNGVGGVTIGSISTGTVAVASNLTLAASKTFVMAGLAANTVATITAGHLLVSSGNITASSGNIVATSGNITVSNGQVSVTPPAATSAIVLSPVAAGCAVEINLPGAANLTDGYIDIDASTGSGYCFDFEASGAFTGRVLNINMTNAIGANAMVLTGAGVRTVPLIDIVDTPSTLASIRLSTTPAAATGSGIVIAVSGTSSAPIIAESFVAAYTGDAVKLDMTNAVGAKAVNVVGAGTRTQPLFNVVDTPGAGGGSFWSSSTSSSATAIPVKLVEAGTSSNDVVQFTCSGAFAGKAIHVTTTNAAAGVAGLVIDGTTAPSGAWNSIGCSGTIAAAGRVLDLTSSGQPAAANSGVCLRIAESGAARATSYAMSINSTNNCALSVATGKSHFVAAVDFMASSVCAVCDNYILASGSGAGIIAGALVDCTGTNIPLADGLRITVKLTNAATVAAGATTMNLNAGGAVNVVKPSDMSSNPSVGYVTNSTVEMIYNSSSTKWLLCSNV